MKFTPHMPVFRLPRKLARIAPKLRQSRFRAVVAVRPVALRARAVHPGRRASGTFLIGRTYVPTHN